MEITGTKGDLSIDVFKQHLVWYNDRDNKVQQLPWGRDMIKD
ncbi:hypothetical protein [Gracilibacillus sp. JCM 18860]